MRRLPDDQGRQLSVAAGAGRGSRGIRPVRARTRRRAAAALLIALLPVGLAACAPGTRAFAARSDAACAKAQRSIERLAERGDTSTGTPLAALRTAIDRYTIVERLVSEISESGLPSGDAGRKLRSSWIEPSRASLADRRADLTALSRAVRDQRDDDVPALAAAADLAGADGVDSAYLGQLGMPACAAVFAG